MLSKVSKDITFPNPFIFLTAWVNLKDVMQLGEISQMQKDKCHDLICWRHLKTWNHGSREGWLPEARVGNDRGGGGGVLRR